MAITLLPGVATSLKPASWSDTQAPTVAINASPAATNTNISLTGQVLENLSGVA